MIRLFAQWLRLWVWSGKCKHAFYRFVNGRFYHSIEFAMCIVDSREKKQIVCVCFFCMTSERNFFVLFREHTFSTLSPQIAFAAAALCVVVVCTNIHTHNKQNWSRFFSLSSSVLLLLLSCVDEIIFFFLHFRVWFDVAILPRLYMLNQYVHKHQAIKRTNSIHERANSHAPA